MNQQSSKTPLDEFLAVTAGSKDLGLIIVKNNSELEHITESLKRSGFNHSEQVADICKFQKTYLVINENAAKDAYDFTVQYPTGQIEVFDKSLMRSETFSPDYLPSSNRVFLVVKDVLNKLQTKGLPLLSAVGPVLQL